MTNRWDCNACAPPPTAVKATRASRMRTVLRHLGFVLLGVAAVESSGCGDENKVNTEPTTVGVQSALLPGTWTPAPSYPQGNPQFIQLLMDGSILAQDTANTWHRYFPDPVVGYAGGHWVATGSSQYQRDGFATGLLRDGRLFIGGGEYVFNPDGSPSALHSKCEIYDPTSNGGVGAWSNLPDYPNSTYLGDGVVAPLPDGRLLVGASGQGGPDGRQSLFFDPTQCPPGVSPCSGNPWSAPDSIPGLPAFSEGSMTLLQNGNVFLSQNGAALFTTATHSWSLVPLPMGYNTSSPWGTNPYGTVCAGSGCNDEGASVLTLYDGRVLITGVTGFTAIYSPTSNTISNVANTPTGSLRMDESDQIVMPTGNALCAIINADHSGPFKFYEYTPPSPSNSLGTFTDVSSSGVVVSGEVLQTPLPDGSVMVASSASPNVYIYRPHDPTQLTTFGQPHITSVTGPVNGVYTLSGTTLNGLTNGANMDDEGQNYTAFPVVWVTYGGQTHYCPVTNVSTASIGPNVAGTLQFRLPDGTPRGTLSVTLSASGLRSSNSASISNGTAVITSPQQYLILS